MDYWAGVQYSLAMLSYIKGEPALLLGLVQAIIVLGVTFGLTLDADQTAAILSVTAIVLSIVTRQTVSPIGKPKLPTAALLVLLALPLLTGCTKQQAQQACVPSMRGAAGLMLAGCTVAYDQARTPEDIAAIDRACLPLLEASEQIERPEVIAAVCGG